MNKSKLSNSKIYVIACISYFVLNIINTYFLTTSTLNRYLVAFDRTFLGEFNAILGNFAILAFFFILIVIFIKKDRKRILALMIVTIALNIALFALTVFTRFYGTALTLQSLTIFNNPAPELGVSILLESLTDLITYYRIVLFIPFVVLLWTYLRYDKNKPQETPRFLVTAKQQLISVLSLTLLFTLNIGIYYGSLSQGWPLNAARSTYASQNIGVYSYYVYEVLGGDFHVTLADGYFSDAEIFDVYDEMNTNKASYENSIDGQSYSRYMQFSDINGLERSDYELTDELNGVFADKNVVLVHLESFNYLLYELEEVRTYLPFFETLFSESYVMHNFYANIGVGTSSDAEFSVLTGLYPTGHSTVYWDYTVEYDELLEPPTLVKYFNERNYYTQAIHADIPAFYNRDVVYPKMMGFQDFYHLNDFIEAGYDNNDYDHPNAWMSDYALMDLTYEKALSYEAQDTPYFLYPLTMMPHTPFLYDPYEGTDSQPRYPEEWESNLSAPTLKYLRYMYYYNNVLERLFIDPQTGASRILEDTVYIFYGDHGAGINVDDFSTLYRRDMAPIEARKKGNQTIAFIYAPSDEYLPTKGINRGKLVGEQHLVRSQVDLYRTMIELFDLPAENDMYFGVNGLSTEPTFSIDSRVLDVVSDRNTYSLLARLQSLDETAEINDTLEAWIFKRKILNDYLIEYNLFNILKS